MPSFQAQPGNPPCTLFFLASFAEGFQFYFVTHTALYRCARKIEGFARDDDTGIALSKHIRCTLREINPFPPTVISSAARNLFRPLFPSSFAKPFRGSTVPAFPAIQCFPFLAAKHAPSYRQRKKSLGSARDDDTGKMLSKHSLCRICWIRASPYREKKAPARAGAFFVSERLICQTVRAWCLLLRQYQ